MRIYGKKREIRDDYYEVEYKEYRQDGTLKAVGTEDFIRIRYNHLQGRFVYVWDGEKRNKGGHRWFDYVGYVLFADGTLKELKAYIKSKYNATEVRLDK